MQKTILYLKSTWSLIYDKRNFWNMSIEKSSIALLSSRALEFSDIFIHIYSVMHKSGTKYLQSFVAFNKRDEIGRTHLVLSKHEI